MEAVDVVVVGAGVVGLACARALALAGRDVLVIESEAGIGMGTSSRNSEVIHAGIYYPPASSKAELCVAGRARLYDYCRARGIAHRRCGKLIVATAPEQQPQLDALQRTAARNGVALQPLSAAAARALEPQLHCVAALASPESGIVDSHALMLSYQGDLEAAGGLCVFETTVVGVDLRGGEAIVATRGRDGELALSARLLVNSAGLQALPLAAAMRGFPAARVPAAHYAKGNYFALSGRAPFDRLIYPVPEAAGLGVHLTIDLGGQARFGPDVEWVAGPDDDGVYAVDPARADAFYAEIRRYWPALPDRALLPAYAGIRPKLQAAGEPARDFLIEGPAEHGVPGVVQLFGIESPGLTASLAIGDRVAAIAAAG
ncbi:MAG: NAD(P)/FAD-dependent oxidoreductase [Lautropia sp.]